MPVSFSCYEEIMLFIYLIYLLNRKDNQLKLCRIRRRNPLANI